MGGFVVSGECGDYWNELFGMVVIDDVVCVGDDCVVFD